MSNIQQAKRQKTVSARLDAKGVVSMLGCAEQLDKPQKATLRGPTSAIEKWRPLGTTRQGSSLPPSCVQPSANRAPMAPGTLTRIALILSLLSRTRLNFSSVKAVTWGQPRKTLLSTHMLPIGQHTAIYVLLPCCLSHRLESTHSK